MGPLREGARRALKTPSIDSSRHKEGNRRCRCQPTLHQHTYLFRQPQQLYVKAPALQPLVAEQRHRCPPTEELRGATGALKGGERKRP